jgi:hypothetical protein
VTSNRFYLISSLCFLTGAILAVAFAPSAINIFLLLGSAFFVIAAALGLAKK